MSMNLHVEAKRSVTVNKTGKGSVQVERFNLWQTPTNVTREILQSGDHLTAYINWVLEDCMVETIPQYAPEDIFCEGEIVGYIEHCAADEHVNELKEWINTMLDEGYEIEFYEL